MVIVKGDITEQIYFLSESQNSDGTVLISVYSENGSILKNDEKMEKVDPFPPFKLYRFNFLFKKNKWYLLRFKDGKRRKYESVKSGNPKEKIWIKAKTPGSIYKGIVKNKQNLSVVYEENCIEVGHGFYYFPIRVPPIKRGNKYLFQFGDEDIAIFQIEKKKKEVGGGSYYPPRKKIKYIKVVKLIEENK